MRVTLAGLSSQYIHVTLAPWCLRHAARKAGRPEEITLCEMNINEPAEQLMRQLMETRPDLLGFSVYIWNRSLTGALIRRSRGGPGAEALTCGAIALEPGRRACTVDGRAVELPPREYELLLCLMRHQGQVLSRSQLLDRVWGIDFEGGDRAVDGRIKALRAALGSAGKQIKTVFKAGYKLEEGAS